MQPKDAKVRARVPSIPSRTLLYQFSKRRRELSSHYILICTVHAPCAGGAYFLHFGLIIFYHANTCAARYPVNSMAKLFIHDKPLFYLFDRKDDCLCPESGEVRESKDVLKMIQISLSITLAAHTIQVTLPNGKCSSFSQTLLWFEESTVA